jgi:5-aminolevulinate synthase
MDFDSFFQSSLETLKAEGNYRVFADLERRCGAFPQAGRHRDGAVSDVTVWCSNDYLGMGQHPDVVQAMVDTVQACGTGAGGTRNIGGNTVHHLALEPNWPTCTARTERCCSPAGTSRTGRRCRHWARASRTR